MISIKWVVEHIGKVSDAFFYRLCQPANAYRRWQLIYCESQPGTRGGVAVILMDDDIPKDWHPVGDIFEGRAGFLTRDQIYRRIDNAVKNLPILDPDENLIRV